jgi:hypothetical protein
MSAFGAADFRAVAAVIPTTGLLLSQSGGINDDNIIAVLIGTSIVTVGSFFLLMIKMRKPWREIRALEKAASDLLPPPAVDATEPRPAH